MATKKIKKVKAVKAWAVFAGKKLIDIWVSRKQSKEFIELEIRCGSFLEYKVIPVLITPIIKN